MQDDVTEATKWAIEQDIADPRRVCIDGTSCGGYAAIEGALKEPELYKCAIAQAGICDPRLMYSRGDTRQTLFGENFLKVVLGEDEADLAARSPITQLDRLKAGVMQIVGGADTRVRAAQGENLHNALARKNVGHEWIYERNEGHRFYTEQHMTEMYTRELALLDRQIVAAADVR